MIHSLSALREALTQARQAAADKGVPLTLERIAVAVGSDTDSLLAFMRDHRSPHDRPRSEKQKQAALLWEAAALCEAELAEHALVRGHSATMPLYLLRRVHDRPGEEMAAVRFVGEEEIAE